MRICLREAWKNRIRSNVGEKERERERETEKQSTGTVKTNKTQDYEVVQNFSDVIVFFWHETRCLYRQMQKYTIYNLLLLLVCHLLWSQFVSKHELQRLTLQLEQTDRILGTFLLSILVLPSFTTYVTPWLFKQPLQ